MRPAPVIAGLQARLEALSIASSGGRYVSRRALLSLTHTCSALRPQSAARSSQPPRKRPAQTPPRVARTLSWSGAEAQAGLLEWAAAPQAPAAEAQQVAAACHDFLQRLGQGSKPSAEQYNKLMAELCRLQRFDLAWRAYRAAKQAGLELRYNGCQRLVSLALKCGDLGAATEAFSDLKARGVQPNKVTYCTLISALCKDKRRGVRSAQLAYQLWRELRDMEGEPLDAAAYRIGMNACVGVGAVAEAQTLLERVAAAGEGADPRAYNILLKHHSRAGDTAALPGLLARMAAAGARPSAVSYNTLIHAYARGGATDEARREMGRAAAAGVRLDAWSYTSLVRAYAQKGEMAAAEGVLSDMRAAGVKPTAVTFSTLLDGYVRAGDMRAALRTLGAMEAAGTAPTAVTYNSLLRGYAAAAGRGGGAADGLQQALGVLESMQARGVAPTTDTFNTLMAAAVAAGRPQLTVELHGRMDATGLRPDALTYTTLLQAYSRLDRVQEAMATFDAMRADGNVAPDVAAYNAAVDVLSRAGEMAAAEGLAEAAARLAQKQGQPPPVEAYGALVAGYARLRQAQPALGAVRRYHAAGGAPDKRMLETLADVSLRVGEYKVAMQSVRALELLGQPLEKHKWRALVAAAERRRERRERRRAAAAAASGAAAALASGSGSDGEGWDAAAAAAALRRPPQRNVYLERLKFWIGLPNSYYSTDDDEEL